MSDVGIDCGVVYVSGVDVVVYVSGVSDCGVVYVSGVGAVVCARQPFFDEERFAVLSGKSKRTGKATHQRK